MHAAERRVPIRKIRYMNATVPVETNHSTRDAAASTMCASMVSARLFLKPDLMDAVSVLPVANSPRILLYA